MRFVGQVNVTEADGSTLFLLYSLLFNYRKLIKNNLYDSQEYVWQSLGFLQNKTKQEMIHTDRTTYTLCFYIKISYIIF